MGVIRIRVELERFTDLDNTILVAAGTIIGDTKIDIDRDGERIELDSAFHLRDRAIEISDRSEHAVAEPVMSGGVIWIERDRLFKFTHRQRRIEIEYVRQKRQVGVRLGEVWIERDRFVCCFFRLWICVRRIRPAEKRQQNVNVGYTRPS